MADIAFDAVDAWMATPIGATVAADNPALTRMADVVLEAMTAAGGDDPDLQLMVLTKVQAMIVAAAVRKASPERVAEIVTKVGPAVYDEALSFLRAMRRDYRKAS